MWSPLADKVLYNVDSEMIVFCQVNKDSQFLRAMKVFKIAFFFKCNNNICKCNLKT